MGRVWQNRKVPLVLFTCSIEAAIANFLLKYKDENFGFDQTTEQSYIIVK